MKLIDIFTPFNANKITNQDGGTWKKKKLKQLGITPKQLMVLSPEQLKKLLSLNPKTNSTKNDNQK